MKTDLIDVLGYVNTGLGFLVALILLVIGLVVVRPVHGTAGGALAGGAGAQIGGIVLVEILIQLRRSAASDARAALSVVTTVVSLGADLAFWGAIVGAAYLLARSAQERRGQPS